MSQLLYLTYTASAIQFLTMPHLWLIAIWCFCWVDLKCHGQAVDHPPSTELIPFIIDIRHSDAHQCSGALVQITTEKDWIVLTHESCAPVSLPKDVISMFAGSTANYGAQGGFHQLRRVVKIYRFGPDLIGLVPHKPFKKTEYVGPFFLPVAWEQIPTSAKFEYVGWDRVSPKPDSAFVAYIIRRTNVPQMYLHSCLNMYAKQDLGHDDVFCLERIPTQKKCHAEKGGVARIMKSEKIYGVFRYSENCKKADRPFVFVRISTWVNIITSSLNTFSVAYAANFTDAPYQINFYYMNSVTGKTEHICSGALITHRDYQFVLTTDQCLPQWRDHTKVVLGAGRFKALGNTPYAQASAIKQMYSKPNGLALIFMQTHLWPTDGVRPIELPIDRVPVKESNIMVTSGYYRSRPTGSYTTDLIIKTNQKVMNTEKCKKAYEDFSFDKDDFFCVEANEKDNVPCDMDSGALAVKWPDSGGPVLMGLQQFSLACSDKTYPYVFKSIPYYYNWINNAIDTHLNIPSASG